MREKGLSNILVILIAGFAGIVLMLYVFGNKSIKTQNIVNTSKSTPAPSITKKDYLRSKGLHVDPVTIKQLELSKKWSYNINKIALSLNKAYLTPTLVENTTQYGSVQDAKKILVLEVNVRDRRIQGNPREIKFQDYFRLRETQKDYAPVGNLYSWKPQEDKIIYVIFPVNLDKEKFQLMLGPFSNPALFELNFKTAKEISGVINAFDGGYSPEFNEDSKFIGIY